MNFFELSGLVNFFWTFRFCELSGFVNFFWTFRFCELFFQKIFSIFNVFLIKIIYLGGNGNKVKAEYSTELATAGVAVNLSDVSSALVHATTGYKGITLGVQGAANKPTELNYIFSPTKNLTLQTDLTKFNVGYLLVSLVHLFTCKILNIILRAKFWIKFFAPNLESNFSRQILNQIFRAKFGIKFFAPNFKSNFSPPILNFKLFATNF